VEFADALYCNNEFLASLYNGLNDEGVILLQLGEAPDPLDPPEAVTEDANRAKIIDLLGDVGMKSFHVYEEFHSNFYGVWTHLVACKGVECDVNWYLNSAELEVEIHQRILRTKDGKLPLHHFDGTTMSSYQTPHKVFENVYCRKVPTPHECILISNKKTIHNAPINSFEFKNNTEGGGLFAKVHIPKGSTIGVESVGSSLHIPQSTNRTIEKYSSISDAKDLESIEAYINEYGYAFDIMASEEMEEHFVETSIMAFVNHGHDDVNIGYVTDYCEDGTNCGSVIENKNDPFLHSRQLYSPLFSRNRGFLFNGFDIALRDIQKGEEIFS